LQDPDKSCRGNAKLWPKFSIVIPGRASWRESGIHMWTAPCLQENE